MKAAKIWVDISMRDSQSYIAVLVFIGGELISQWAERVESNNSTRSEYFAIYRACQMAQSMGLENVDIKCDNSTAVLWAQRDDPQVIPDLMLRPIQADLFHLIPRFQSFTVKLIHRATNRAHALAHKLLKEAEICDSTPYFSPIVPGLEWRRKDGQREVEDDDYESG